MKKYTNLEKLINKETKERTKEKTAFILNGYGSDTDRGLKYYSTDTRWNQYTAGTIDRKKATELATKRALKEIEKEAQKKREKIENALNAADIVTVSIQIEWTKSYMWGYNPTATVIASDKAGHYYKTYGHATGCGYDKESAATAEALNQIDGLKKALYEMKERAIRKGTTANAGSTSNENFITYGAGYGVLPYFEGGVGIGCHKAILDKAGIKKVTENHGKLYDYYYFERA